MDYVQGLDRHQLMMTSYDQLVAADSFARIIDAFVEAFDLHGLGFKNTLIKPQGRPPYHPKDLLKLYLYGYQHQLRSCRKLEHATKVNLEVVWLVKGARPHYKTIANFRKENEKPIRSLFRGFVLMLKEWKLVDGRELAIDSVKIRAQNSLKNNFNQSKLDRHFDYIDQKIDGYMEQLKTAEEKGPVQEKIDHQVGKWNRYCELEEQLMESGGEQISTTDPDARAVILHRNIVNVGYNIQAASDAKNKLIVALDTGSVNDTHALGPMVDKVRGNLGLRPNERMKVLADKGYHTGAELAACEEKNVATFVSPKANPANKRFQVFPMGKFSYHAASDTYRCPAGELLRSNGSVYHRNGRQGKKNAVPFKHYKTKACKGCPIRPQCTSGERGRVIQRSLYQAAIDRNNKRVHRNPGYYRKRQQIIEHQFGTIKRQWGFTHALMRGKGNVLAEASIIFTVYNLRRSVSILGFNALLKHLKGLLLTFILLCRAVAAEVAHCPDPQHGGLWRSSQRNFIFNP